MENKLKIEGSIEVRVAYLTSEGKSRVLKIEDSFTEMLEVQGLTEGCFVNEKLQVKAVEINILNERKIHMKADIDCQVRAARKENIEFIHEINPASKLQTLNKQVQVNSFIGHGETKISMQEKLEIENLQESIEVIKLEPTITNIEKKMSYNKVLVKADCNLKCLYITEAGMVYITKKDVPIMGFLDIENVEDTNDCNIEFSVKNMQVTENEKEVMPVINVEIEFNVSGDVYQTKEINILEDLYCLNHKAEFTTQKISLEGCGKDIIQTSKIKQKVVIEDINQIYDTECTILNTQTAGKYIEGDMKLTYIYSSFENPNINRKEEIVKFQLPLENEARQIRMQVTNSRTIILPDSSVDTELDVEIYDDETENREIQLINNIEIGEENDDDGYSMIVYFVKKDDSLWKIAKKFKSTVGEIATINEIENEDNIQIGDKLYIPRAM